MNLRIIAVAVLAVMSCMALSSCGWGRRDHLNPRDDFRYELASTLAEDNRVVLRNGRAIAPRNAPARGFITRFLDTMYALEDLCWSYQLNEARQRKDVTVMVRPPG